jgi:hypothetical protein
MTVAARKAAAVFYLYRQRRCRDGCRLQEVVIIGHSHADGMQVH